VLAGVGTPRCAYAAAVATRPRGVRRSSPHFNRNGFFEAQVQPEVRTDSANGLANIDFRTTLGRRADFAMWSLLRDEL